MFGAKFGASIVQLMIPWLRVQTECKTNILMTEKKVTQGVGEKEDAGGSTLVYSLLQ